MIRGSEPARRAGRKGLLALTLGNARFLFHWPPLAAVILAVLAGIFPTDSTIKRHLEAFLNTETQAVATLFGIVVAALAIVTAVAPNFLSHLRARGKLQLLNWAFWWVAALAVWALVADGLGIVLAGVSARLDRWLFAVTTMLSSWTVFETLSLVPLIFVITDLQLEPVAKPPYAP